MTRRDCPIDTLYRINDHLTALLRELGLRYPDDDAEDSALNDATHAVALAFGLSDPDPTPRERAAALLTDTDIAGILAGA